jgi:hypothetical protein
MNSQETTAHPIPTDLGKMRILALASFFQQLLVASERMVRSPPSVDLLSAAAPGNSITAGFQSSFK